MSAIIALPTRAYSAREIAKMLGISDSYFIVLQNNRVVTPFVNEDGDTVRGMYPIEAIAEAFKWALEKARQKGIKNTSALEEAKTVKMEQSAEQAILQTAIFKGQLLRMEDVKQEFSNIMITFRNRMLSLPTYVARLLEEKSYEQIVAILTDIIRRDILPELSELDIQKVRSYNKKLMEYTDVMQDPDNSNNSNGDGGDGDETKPE